ncbi:A/G-specific adenine glycosylase (EC [Olavius sp. associated proteobacterium Delta 1]|nr:A/G-specific adenine glycosylase (EC [Olavius sp. associated proteobacterium Delta 1]
MKPKEIHALRKALIDWYLVNQRDLPWRKVTDPYPIWVSEVMLQQTQVATVLPYYHEFLKRFPNLQKLARANFQQVLKAWEGLGYYARARNLHKAAGVVLNQHLGNIPQSRPDFRKLPGVGDYIAAAVLSIAFSKPYSVVDGNVKRVLSRLFIMDEPVNQSSAKKIYQQAAADLLDTQKPGTFNQALMELGAIVCKPRNPLCPACPVQTWCLAYQRDRISEFPRKLKKKATPQYPIAVGVVFKNSRVIITRRKPEGLLGGLWEFPGGKIKKNETAKAACIREIKEEVNLAVKVDSHLCMVKHAYTHFKIQMDVFCCSYISGRVKLTGPVDHRWIRLNQLDDYPLPKANHKFLAKLRQWKDKEFGSVKAEVGKERR